MVVPLAMVRVMLEPLLTVRLMITVLNVIPLASMEVLAAVAPSKVTVPPLSVKVGEPDFVKLSEIVNDPDEFGAVKFPPERVKVPFTSTVPELPVKVPDETVRPALKVWVADPAV